MARLLVIGGGPAGMAAASKAKREKPDLEVIVAEAGKYVSFALCGIPYYLAGVVEDINELVHYTPEYFREKRKIDVRIKTKVTSVDFSGKKAILEYENGREEEVEWDYLVIATGAKPRTFPLPGLDLEGIYTIRSLDDAVMIKEAAKKAEKVVIVGGGYIGLEVAEAFRILGKKVTVIEALDHVLPNVDKDIADYVEEELRRNGIEIKKEQKVETYNFQCPVCPGAGFCRSGRTGPGVCRRGYACPGHTARTFDAPPFCRWKYPVPRSPSPCSGGRSQSARPCQSYSGPRRCFR